MPSEQKSADFFLKHLY